MFVQWTVGLCFLFPVSEFHWEFFRPCKRSVDNDQYQPTIRFLNAIPLTCASVIVWLLDIKEFWMKYDWCQWFITMPQIKFNFSNTDPFRCLPVCWRDLVVKFTSSYNILSVKKMFFSYSKSQPFFSIFFRCISSDELCKMICKRAGKEKEKERTCLLHDTFLLQLVLTLLGHLFPTFETTFWLRITDEGSVPVMHIFC